MYGSFLRLKQSEHELAACCAVDPSECQRYAIGSAAPIRMGLKVRTDTWARRQAPLQDITGAHKHVSLSKEKMKSLRMVR